MNTCLSEGAWIDRFIIELARLGAAVDPEILSDMAREVWPFLGDLPPEEIAGCQWDRTSRKYSE